MRVGWDSDKEADAEPRVHILVSHECFPDYELFARLALSFCQLFNPACWRSNFLVESTHIIRQLQMQTAFTLIFHMEVLSPDILERWRMGMSEWSHGHLNPA